MRPFKFLNGKPSPWDVASWDFHQDYAYPLPPQYQIEREYYDSFLSFLSKFDVDDTVLVDVIRLVYDDDSYMDIDHDNFDFFLEEFSEWNGRVKITWLNFDVI